MNQQGLKKIKEFIKKDNFKESCKIRGVKIANPKKLLLNYYNQIIRKEGGKRQIEAAYHHCCNIVMHHEGMSDKEINFFWWSKLKDHGNKKSVKKSIKKS